MTNIFSGRNTMLTLSKVLFKIYCEDISLFFRIIYKELIMKIGFKSTWGKRSCVSFFSVLNITRSMNCKSMTVKKCMWILRLKCNVGNKKINYDSKEDT